MHLPPDHASFLHTWARKFPAGGLCCEHPGLALVDGEQEHSTSTEPGAGNGLTAMTITAAAKRGGTAYFLAFARFIITIVISIITP